MAKAGISSRRKAEDLIREGSVTINGKVAKIGDKATMGEDAIKVNGKLLQKLEAPVYILFHKPKGVLSTMSDPENRPTLSEFLTKFKMRLFPIGRLDFNSEGLLLLTNDGQFAEDLQKQSDLLRVYQVKVRGHLTKEEMSRLSRGGRMGPRHQQIKPFSVRLAKDLTNKSMLEIAFQGAGAVDLKTYLEAKGFLVERIVRTAIGHLVLSELPAGQYRILTESQVKALIRQPELGLRRLKEGEKDQQAQPLPAAEIEAAAEAAKTREGIAAQTYKVVKSPRERTGGRPTRPDRSFGPRSSERGDRPFRNTRKTYGSESGPTPGGPMDKKRSPRPFTKKFSRPGSPKPRPSGEFGAPRSSTPRRPSRPRKPFSR
ncbi:MAG: hypothetical protein A2X97_13380 [Bdellovibrionales bacterium GWA1_52_35]|nr:MAG: hypothetical protein A2X97_13380 [Bdellovibrionales bacterium GWA1_52_35]